MRAVHSKCTSIFGNLAYVILMAQFAGENTLIIEILEAMNAFYLPNLIYLIIFIYSMCFILSFFLQIYRLFLLDISIFGIGVGKKGKIL